MKKLCAVWIVFVLLLLPLAAPVQAVISSDSSGLWPGVIDRLPAPSFASDFDQPSVEWLAFVNGEKPATFSKENIHVDLADSVIEIDSQVTSRLATAGQLLSGAANPLLRPDKIVAEGGYIDRDFLDEAAKSRGRSVKNGTVFVDTDSGTAFKVVSPSVFSGAFDANDTLGSVASPLDNTYGLARPQLSEILDDFELTQETIRLTRGNISGFAPHIEKNLVLPGWATNQAFGDSLKDFKYLSDDPLIKLQFTEQTLQANLGDGGKIEVTVSGGLGIEDIDLTGRYSGFDGYRIELTLKQESYLIVEMSANVNQEVYIPILGLDIPFGVGRISGGIFAVVGLDGSLSLEIEARDYTETTMGVRGGTKFYIPTSVKPIFSQGFTSDGDVDLNGDIDGYLKFGPMVGLELFGFDLVGAGVFLGAGVHVQTDNKMLDVNLYGLFNVYVKLAGKTLNLANYKPTILRRRQSNTAGYRIKVIEAFISPGLVGGVIEREIPATVPPRFEIAQSMEYRILVIPDGTQFDPNSASPAEQAGIRKYPATGYATTNVMGEFYQADPHMLYDKDKVVIEFRVGGESYYSNPATPNLPFSSFTIAKADSFNDFATGQVNPIRSIDWEDGVPDVQYKWTYCGGAIVNLSQYLSLNYDQHVPTGDQAIAYTDAWGNFDTRKPPLAVVPGKQITNDGFDVYETPSNWGSLVGYDVSLNYNRATTTGRVSARTTFDISFDRTVQLVPNSFKKYEEDGKLIHQVQYDESIWIVNPNGTRTVTSDEFRYNRIVFSTQDLGRTTDYHNETDLVRNYQWVLGESGKHLIPLLDAEGHETGAALFKERVTVEWVWQKHPNPVTITSDDHTTVNQQGGTYAVTATGYAPFAFSVSGAPTGVQIDKSGGQLQIPADMAAGDYDFLIRAEEDRSKAGTSVALKDPYQGQAPSPPDEQAFKLTVMHDPGVTSPTPTLAPTPTLVPTPTLSPTPTTTPSTAPVRLPPVIAAADHGYAFTKLIGSGDYVVPIEADGSEPISWALERLSERYPFPENASIDAKDATTGALTLRDGLEPGTYYFVIRANNGVGTDTQECTVRYIEIRPVLPHLQLPAIHPGMTMLDFPGEGDTQPDLLAAKQEDPNWNQTLPFIQSPEFDYDDEHQPSDIVKNLPLNAATIRYDHPEDVYTLDRDTVNGADYVHWHACPGVMTPHDAGMGVMLYDEAPLCDNYHYYEPSTIPAGLADQIESAMRDRVNRVLREDLFLGAPYTRNSLEDAIDAYVVNPLDSVTHLEYGSILDDMSRKGKGTFKVDLNQDTGTFVAGDFFVGLADTPEASLLFEQPGAAIVFDGGDLQADADTSLYIFDFGFKTDALHKNEMLSAAGLAAEEETAFVYSFGYHGDLPGIATFSVKTDLAGGEKVYVYRYDGPGTPASGGSDRPFTLIAGEVQVMEDGLVTYKNNTMSEYLITTKRIDGAAESVMAAMQEQNTESDGSGWVIGGIALAATAAVALVVFFRRRRVRGMDAR